VRRVSEHGGVLCLVPAGNLWDAPLFSVHMEPCEIISFGTVEKGALGLAFHPVSPPYGPMGYLALSIPQRESLC
jgi:hypothetical protein